MALSLLRCLSSRLKRNPSPPGATLWLWRTKRTASGTLLPGKIGLFISFSIAVYAFYSISVPVLQDIVASQAEPSQKNLVMGFYNATKSLGSIIGSLLAGFLYGFHVKLPFMMVVVIYGAALVVAVIGLGYSRKET